MRITFFKSSESDALWCQSCLLRVRGSPTGITYVRITTQRAVANAERF